MKYRSDFVTNSSSSSSIYTVVIGKNSTLTFEADFEEIRFHLDTLADEEDRLNYTNILKYIARAKIVQDIAKAYDGAAEIDRDGNELFSFSEIPDELLISGGDGIDGLDKGWLTKELNKKHSEEARKYLNNLLLLKNLDYTCDSYEDFINHPLWQIYPFDEVNRPVKIEESVSETWDDGGHEISTNLNLKTLKMKVDIESADNDEEDDEDDDDENEDEDNDEEELDDDENVDDDEVNEDEKKYILLDKTGKFTWSKKRNAYVGKFIVVGVGYENRQNIIEKLNTQDPVEIRLSSYEGEPAIQVFHKDKHIGYIARTDIDNVLDIQKRITGVTIKGFYKNINNDRGVVIEIEHTKS